MKSILMSIQPKWVAKILNGEKTIEIRKRFPKDYRGWVYIYCTKLPVNKQLWLINKDNKGVFQSPYGKVVARFYCDKITSIGWCERYIGFERTGEFYRCSNIGVNLLTKSCLSLKEINDYLGTDINKIKEGYAIHISQLEIFDKPKELSDFFKVGVNKWYHEHAGTDMPYLEFWGTFYDFKITKAPQSYMWIEEVEE